MLIDFAENTWKTLGIHYKDEIFEVFLVEFLPNFLVRKLLCQSKFPVFTRIFLYFHLFCYSLFLFTSLYYFFFPFPFFFFLLSSIFFLCCFKVSPSFFPFLLFLETGEGWRVRRRKILHLPVPYVRHFQE